MHVKDNRFFINKPFPETYSLLKSNLHSSNFIIKKLTSNKILLHSPANYGSSSMIGSEKYRVKISLLPEENHPLIVYRIIPNDTFLTLSVIIPLMTLPVSLIIALSSSFQTQSSNTWLVFLIVSFLVGLSVAILQQHKNRIQQQGEQDFQELLSTLV